jgi:hypothetical protein
MSVSLNSDSSAKVAGTMTILVESVASGGFVVHQRRNKEHTPCVS